MPSFDEVEKDLFFDSVECFSAEGSELSDCENSEYRNWLNEPQSVAERRCSFLSGIGFIDFASRIDEVSGLDNRVLECSSAVSSTSGSCREGWDSECCGRETNSDANSVVEYETYRDHSEEACESVSCGSSFRKAGESKTGYKRMKKWWKHFVKRRKESKGRCLSNASKLNSKESRTNKVKMKSNKKRSLEFTGVYMEQEIQAHEGCIWTMKFSLDGQYLATGGEDGVVRVWRVTSVDSSCKSFTCGGDLGGSFREFKSSHSIKEMKRASVVIPEKIFQIEESPMQELYGHVDDVLDLAWSTSNCLLSSSKDKTVRLWQVGHDRCLNVFHHVNYVTCIQFNPCNDNYFISGSLDGKVRIWGLRERRVVDWVDIRDVVTAVCYRPDGKGFVVGSMSGTCRFYEGELVNDLQLEAEIRIGSRKRSSGNRITGIQLSRERPPTVMITSEDSKVRIFDGVDLVEKFKGRPRSGSQMSASFTSTGRHIISVGEDSRVYVWNYGGLSTPLSKHVKSTRACEHFFCESVSIAIPWLHHRRGCCSGSSHAKVDEIGNSWRRNSERGSWLFMDGPCMGASLTWPEERLPISEGECLESKSEGGMLRVYAKGDDFAAILSEAWGGVIATAGGDGMIRTFHNYGLPIRT